MLVLALSLLFCAHAQEAPPAAPVVDVEDPAVDPGVPVRDDGVVRVEGPEVPPHLWERLQPLLSVRGAYLADLGEAGALVTTRLGEVSQVHLIAQPGGARTQLTFGTEPVRDARFVPGSNAVSWLGDVGGNEAYQLHRLDLDTGEHTVLTDGVSRNAAYTWRPDGSMVAYSSNARTGQHMDIWVSDGRDPASASLVVEVEGYFTPLEFSPDGRWLLLQEYVSINESRLYRVDVDAGTSEALTPDEPAAAYPLAAWGPDGSLVVATDRGGEHVHLWSLADGAWTDLTPDLAWSVEDLAVSPDQRYVAYAVNEDGWSTLHLHDLKRGSDRTADIVKGIVGDLRWHGTTVAMSLSRPDAPTDVLSVDRRGRMARWTTSELGGLPAGSLVEPELVHYPTFDDRQIPCFVYKPAGPGPHPVVFSIHGGPEGQARPWLSPLTQALVGSGFAVLVPNVRGSDGYGREYLLLDNGRQREDSVRDIGALLDWVDSQPDLDASRIGVRGGSYGGYMVLASLVHYGDRIRAGADAVGISSFVTFLENTKPYRQDLRRAEYGDERDPQMRAFLEEISPLNHASELQSELLVVHGANDPRVPVSEAEQLLEAVRAGGHEAWYVLARNEGHGFRKRANRDLYIATSVLFFEQALGVE